MTYSEGTASVSCVDSTSSVSGHQVILLQLSDNNLIVETIRSGRQVSLPVPRGRYCIMELPIEDNELVYSEVRYSSEFIAEDSFTTIAVVPTTVVNIVTGGIDKNIIISKLAVAKALISCSASIVSMQKSVNNIVAVVLLVFVMMLLMMLVVLFLCLCKKYKEQKKKQTSRL